MENYCRLLVDAFLERDHEINVFCARRHDVGEIEGRIATVFHDVVRKLPGHEPRARSYIQNVLTENTVSGDKPEYTSVRADMGRWLTHIYTRDFPVFSLHASR